MTKTSVREKDGVEEKFRLPGLVSAICGALVSLALSLICVAYGLLIS